MNGVLIVDKPGDWTSHDVIAKLRGVLGVRRIGHSGTLDPMATGVLPVFIGRATRAVEFCESDEKEYLAALRLGLVTDTQDITGHVLGDAGVAAGEEALRLILPRFTGELAQIPPMYSAVRVGGRRLYDLARRGLETPRAARQITVRELSLLGVTQDGDYLLRVICSKGTYVRTLCHDIGAALGCGGVLASLRRTRAGRFTLAQAHTLDALLGMARDGTAGAAVRPVDSVFAELPAYAADGSQAAKCRNGAAFPVPGAPGGRYRVYAPDGGFLMLGECRDGMMHTVKSFFEV